eukprot:3105866-Pleurochrysis_carterae.AAC.2
MSSRNGDRSQVVLPNWKKQRPSTATRSHRQAAGTIGPTRERWCCSSLNLMMKQRVRNGSGERERRERARSRDLLRVQIALDSALERRQEAAAKVMAVVMMAVAVMAVT